MYEWLFTWCTRTTFKPLAASAVGRT